MTKEKNGKKKTSVFWRGYVIFCLLGIAFWLLVIGYVRSCLVKYEKAQPYHLVDALLEEIRSGDVTTFFDAQQEVSPFEKAGTREDAFLESIAGKALTYRKDAGNYDVMKPVYRLYADEECIGTVTLKEVSSQPLMLILSVGQWQIAEAVPASGTEGIQVSVMAPDNCKVYINDKELGEAQLTGNEKALEQFQYSQDYVKVPKLLEYQVDGLFSEPSVRICSEDGREFECQTSREDGRIEVVADKFPASEMDEQLGAQAIENAKRWSNFFSVDLAGCHGSVDPIRNMFPEKSYYLQMADIYRREDMWMYNDHSAPVFSNETVSNFTEYTQDLVSCEIYFEKTMKLTKTGDVRTIVTHSVYYYGKLNGKWVILDMQDY